MSSSIKSIILQNISEATLKVCSLFKNKTKNPNALEKEYSEIEKIGLLEITLNSGLLCNKYNMKTKVGIKEGRIVRCSITPSGIHLHVK